MAAMRLAAHVNDKGEPFSASISFFSSLFSHTGFVRTIDGVTEEDALKELDKLIVLRMEYWEPGADGAYTNALTCTSELLSVTTAIER